MPGQSFDRVAAIYDESRGGQRRGDSFAAAIAPWVIGSRVVEAGIGTGVIAAGLRRFGHDVVGFDLSDAMLRTAITRVGERVAIADVDRLPIPDATVDTLTFVWVLQLVADPAVTLVEAARVVRPGGRVIAVVGTTDDHPDDEIGQILRRMAELRGSDRSAARMVADASTTLDLLHDGFTGWDHFVDTPAAQIELIENRGWSSLFHTDDDTWARVVVPVLDQLRSLPEPQQPRERQNRHPLVVWERG